jgi:hypothetical protein
MDGATPVNSSTAAKIKRKTGIVTLPQNMFLLVGVIISEDALENKDKTSPGHMRSGVRSSSAYRRPRLSC